MLLNHDAGRRVGAVELVARDRTRKLIAVASLDASVDNGTAA
jgi:hypothetical protein